MSTSGEEREYAEELLARFVDVGQRQGFDRKLFEALHPGAASHLAQVLGSPPGPDSARIGGAAAKDGTRAMLQRLSGGCTGAERYRAQEEIARGGQGSILRVLDESLGRHLAMKVTHSSEPAPDDPENTHVTRSLGRFVEEARVTAQLDHPGIVPVHEFGKDAAGRLYFTMKLVKGRDLKEVFGLVARGEEGWTRTRALAVLLRVCEGMAYAHSKGVIHRDLKPANVMVGRFGEVYVMDWGLARILDQEDTRDVRIRPPMMTTQVHSLRHDSGAHDEDSPLITMDGDVVGTPAYMSPEQANGELERMGPHSDVYSAGAMLYHLLAGSPPYVPAGRRLHNYAIWARVQEGPPQPLFELAPDTPAELLAICDKAMARDPERRYRDMSELAEDLGAYLEHRVVHAYETGAVAELRKWIGRNRPLALSLAAALIAVVGGLAAVGWIERRGRERAEELRMNVLRLSAFRELEALRERAELLWPAVPERGEDFRAWLRDAEALWGELPRHEAALAQLRERALVPVEEPNQSASATHPLAAELALARGRRDALKRALARPEDRSAPALAIEARADPRDAYTLNEKAWLWVDPGRTEFGHEAEGLLLAEKAAAAPLPRGLPEADLHALSTNVADTLAWAYFAIGLDEQALRTSREAFEQAPRGLEPLAADYYQRVRAGLEERQRCGVFDLRRLERRCQTLEWQVRGARFDNVEDHWQYEQLERLVEEIEALRDPRAGLASDQAGPGHGWGVARRLRLADSLEGLSLTSSEARSAWIRAAQQVAVDPRFGGLTLGPQRGLFPLGPDPESGLWEFAVVQSGRIPERGEDGELYLDSSSAIVLVFVPGGTFLMGAQARFPDAQGFDLRSSQNEGPPHEVELPPVFLSKYELTQGQWLFLDGDNPSFYAKPGSKAPESLRHPVEMVSWVAGRRVLARLGLRLPTEAEWEYAARAGTTSPWWTGDDEYLLDGAANLSGDQDGYPQHSPVDAFAPNPFGLHGMIGNVHEWCEDVYSPDFYSRAARRAPRNDQVVAMDERVLRGGSFAFAPVRSRASSRLGAKPEVGMHVWGLRPARSLDP